MVERRSRIVATVSALALGLALALPLVAAAAPSRAATYPGHNGKLVFDDGDFDFFTIPTAGGRATDLGLGADAAWSPDGKSIAYIAVNDLRIMDAQGRHDRRVARFAQLDIGCQGISWSPDGRTLVASIGTLAQAAPGGRSRCALLVVPAAGGTTRRLEATGSHFDIDPAWAPNGTSIAFARCTAPQACKLLLIRPDGTGAARLLRTGAAAAGSQADPSWSPGSTHIAYSRQDDGTIHVVDSQGRGDHVAITAGVNPAWSPDGRQIAYEGASGDGETCSSTISVATLSTRTTREVVATCRGSFNPDWQPLH